MTEKYVERIITKSGIRWGVYPKKEVRAATGYSGKRWDYEDDANRYSREIQSAWRDHKDAQRDSIHIPSRTVDSLIHYYYTTNEFQDRLRKHSKLHYRLSLKTAAECLLEGATKPFGSYFFHRIDAKTADKLYARIKEQHSDHRAAMCMKALRRVWYVCARHGRTSFDNNPFKKMSIAALPSRKVRWTPEQIDTFVDTADNMGPKYSAVGTMVLMCYELCQRPVDVRKITWGNIKQGDFIFTQQKTGVEVQIPMTDVLEKRLASLPKSNEHQNIVINPATQRPFDRRLYSKYAAEIRKEAGLPDHLKIGDLRRTGATEMAHSGCTDDEMRAVTGHQTRDVLSIYIVPTAHMARTAMSKRQRKAF